MAIIVNQGGQICAYQKGDTFSEEQIKLIKNTLSRYDFYMKAERLDPEQSKITIFADNVEHALQAMGVGSSYELQWGDNREFLEAYTYDGLDCVEVVTIENDVRLPTLAEFLADSRDAKKL